MEQDQNEQPGGEDRWFSNVGATLRVLRRLRRLSQLELAQKAGLSQVVTYETGRASPSLRTLSRLLDALEINPIVFAYALAAVDGAEERLPEGQTRLGSDQEVAETGRLLDHLVKSSTDLLAKLRDEARRADGVADPSDPSPGRVTA
jgi:transcriptional regulator with XRE-family HTH domain